LLSHITKTRSILVIDRGRGLVTKYYKDVDTAAREIRWYQDLDYAHPELIDADLDKGVMVTRYYPPCIELPDYRPIGEIVNLLRRLEAEGIHHRDVHIENVVQAPDGPLLIDWETAIRMPGHKSYDLHGPDSSGVPAPDIHLRFPHYRMWLGAEHKKSLKTVWGISELPASMD